VCTRTELWLYDIKHHDAGKFREYTGGDLGLVFSNLEKLAALGARIWVRIPLVPTVNSSQEDMKKISAAIKAHIGASGAERVEIMPFHRLGEGKYKSLGKRYDAESIDPPDSDAVESFKNILSDEGFSVI